MTQGTERFDLKATLCLIGAVLCWSAVPLFLKHFTAFIDGWTANGLRYPLAMLVWLPWLVALLRQGRRARRFYVRALVPTSVNLAGQCLWAWAPYYIDPGLIAFVIRLNVIWAIIAAMLIFTDERGLIGSGRFWLGLAVAMTGFVGVSIYGGALKGGATLTGVLLTLACSLMWGLYSVTVRWSTRDVDARSAFALIGCYTAVGTLVLMFVLGEPGRATTMPLGSFVLLVISALVGISTAHVLFYAALARLGVTICSGASLASAFITAAVSWQIYDERLAPQQWVSGLALICGAAVLIWAQQHLSAPATSRKPADVDKIEPFDDHAPPEGESRRNDKP